MLSEFRRVVGECIAQRCLTATFGSQLRRARINAGYTLKEISLVIGYSWVAVARWEQDMCLPKPGVLWHLRHLYGTGGEWAPAGPGWDLPVHEDDRQLMTAISGSSYRSQSAAGTGSERP
jgi:transcriptional regulator with XRE-family HTH domain